MLLFYKDLNKYRLKHVLFQKPQQTRKMYKETEFAQARLLNLDIIGILRLDNHSSILRDVKQSD